MQYNRTVGCVDIHIDTKRIDENLKRAQDLLDGRVLNDMKEYIPMDQQKALRNATHIVQPGLIESDTPYAHYQYTGELYLTEDGRSWARAKEHKYPTGMPLHYHAPGTSDHWFERAKETHKKEWIDIVKREVGKG
jgi:hypothetical protein|nr:MAG TPA: Minor capsid protein [Caudoviricetes sp.]DAW11427.1 MAG TPA: Minor capsid protein [Caudoviricetes sp.]